MDIADRVVVSLSNQLLLGVLTPQISGRAEVAQFHPPPKPRPDPGTLGSHITAAFNRVKLPSFTTPAISAPGAHT